MLMRDSSIPRHIPKGQATATSAGAANRVEPVSGERYEVESRGQQQRQPSDTREDFSLFPRNVPLEQGREPVEVRREVRTETRPVRLGDEGDVRGLRAANPRESAGRLPTERELQRNDVRPDPGPRRDSAAPVNQPTVSTQPRRSGLSDLGERFVRIAAGNFPECGDFLDRHPSILGVDFNSFVAEAIAAQKSGNTSRARSCVQQSIILRKGRNLRGPQLNTFIADLFAKDRALLRELTDHFDITFYEVTKKATSDETESQSATVPDREPRASDTNNAGRRRPSEANAGRGTDDSRERRNDQADRGADLTDNTRPQIGDRGASGRGVVQRSQESDRGARSDPRDARIGPRDARTAPRDARIDPRDTRTDSRDARTGMREVERDTQRGTVDRDLRTSENDREGLSTGVRDLDLNTRREPPRYQRRPDEGSVVSGPSVLPGKADFSAKDQPDDPHLDPRYRVPRNGGQFFVRGRVFIMLWHESVGGNHKTGKQNNNGNTVKGRFQQQVHTEPRRFIVVRERSAYSWCIPISTYGGQGVAKAGIKNNIQAREAHSVVYASDDTPYTSPEEKNLMTKRPIEVDLKSGHDLHRMSRLNFGKPQSVEWNIKAMDIGMVSEDSEQRFADYWRMERDYSPARPERPQRN